MTGFRKTALIVSAFVLTAALAYILGLAAAKLVRDKDTESYVRARDTESQGIVDQMGTIRIGDTLPDFTFYTLDRMPVRLSELTGDRTVINIFEPSCHTCLAEIEDLQTVVKDSEDFRHFLFVSAADPALLRELRDRTRLASPILYDDSAAAIARLNVLGFPFNIVIDRNRRVVQLVSGPLTREELTEVVRSNHSR